MKFYCKLCALILISFNNFVSSEDARPNFIIMVMDDLGWGDLGILGNPNKDTPNIDQMAAEGMLFTDFYSGAPLCSPSRAALLTGRLPVRNGFYTTNAHARNSYTPQEIVGGITNETLVSQLLAKAGYATKLIGKWHLGHKSEYLPTEHGFEEYFGSTNCHFGPYDNKNTPNIPVFRNKEMAGRYYEDFVITPDGESNITQLLIDEMIESIESYSNQSRNFFLYWAPDSMHGPVYASKQFIGSSKKGRYGDAVREVDFGIGQILKTLHKTGLDKSTYIFFVSDNGPALVDKTKAGSSGPFLCGKQTTFEGGMRVPAIAWSPTQIKPNQVSHQLATVMDLFSTVLDLADVSPPENTVVDGISLRSSLVNNTVTKRPVFFYRGNELFAMRYGMYKIHLWTWTNSMEQFLTGIDFCPGQEIQNVTTHDQTNHTQLPVIFDLGNDPSERFPLSDKWPVYKSVLPLLMKLINEHKSNLNFGEPQLNWCDLSVMHWAPPGCEKLDRCLEIPPSKPYKCPWPH